MAIGPKVVLRKPFMDTLKFQRISCGFIVIQEAKNIKNVTICRDSRSAKSIKTR